MNDDGCEQVRWHVPRLFTVADRWKGARMALLTRAQIDEIQQRLDEGMSPEAIADSIGRVADLDELDIVTIRSVAYDLVNGEPVRASDDN